MLHLRALVCGLAVALLTTGLIYGQAGTKDTKDTPAKVKGQLPSGWSKLKLTQEQKLKVYKVQQEYKVKIDELKKQITALQGKQRAEMVSVLTPEQKEKLKNLAIGTEPKK